MEPFKMKARPYQLKAIELTKQAIVDGHKKIMIFMATGGGKGFLFQHFCKSAHDKNKKVLLVMRRRALIFQSKKRLEEVGLKPSVIMGTEKGFDPNKNVQLCSIDTIGRRKNIDFIYDYDLVIADEGHDCTSPIYQDFFSKFGEKTFFISLTATPFLNGKKAHTFWDCCVKPVEMEDLKNQGYLVPCALYIPHEIDLSGIETASTGDYKTDQLASKMKNLEIVGNVIDDYKTIGKMKPAICFCVNKDHSIMLAQEFCNQGIPAKHADESTPQKERDAILKEFKEGKIQVICNVNIFSTGVDLPEIEVAIMARPTRSEILYIQQVGRAFRPYRKCGKCHSQYDNSPNCPVCGYNQPSYIKREAIIIDSGNNHSRHGHPYDIRYPVMNDEDKKSRTKKDPPISKTCKHCFYVYDANLATCPMCDEETELPKTLFKTKDGKIVPYDEYSVISGYFEGLLTAEITQNWKPNAKFFKLYEKFGDRAMKFKKEFGMPSWIPSIVKKQKEKEMAGKLYTGEE